MFGKKIKIPHIETSYVILSLYLATLSNIYHSVCGSCLTQFSDVTMQHRRCCGKALAYIIHEKQT